MTTHIVESLTSKINSFENNDAPKIYVACLAAYNNGYLHGKWVDASQDAETIREEILEMLSKSPVSGAEEWAIHGYEGFGSIYLSESSDIEDICEMASFIAKHGELGAGLIAYFNNLENAEDALENNYYGEHSTELDFATQFFDDIYLHSIPDNLSAYIDYEAFKYDIFINDFFSLTVKGNVHVFSHL